MHVEGEMNQEYVAFEGIVTTGSCMGHLMIAAWPTPRQEANAAYERVASGICESSNISW